MRLIAVPSISIHAALPACWVLAVCLSAAISPAVEKCDVHPEADQSETSQVDAARLAALLDKGAGHHRLAARIRSTLSAVLADDLQYEHVTDAQLVLKRPRRFTVRFHAGDSSRDYAVQCDGSTLALVDVSGKTYRLIDITSFSGIGELFLESTPINDLPSFVWWTKRVSGKEFVSAFHSVARLDPKTLDGVDCTGFRLTTACGVSVTLYVPDDGVPRRWIMDGTGLLPPELTASNTAATAKRVEDWNSVAFPEKISESDNAAFTFDPRTKNYTCLEDYLISEPVAAKRLRGTPNPVWDLPIIPDDPAVSLADSRRFSSRGRGPCVIVFAAGWSLASRRSLPFYAALANWIKPPEENPGIAGPESFKPPTGDRTAPAADGGAVNDKPSETVESPSRRVRQWLTAHVGPDGIPILKSLADRRDSGETQPTIIIVWLDQPRFVRDVISRIFSKKDTGKHADKSDENTIVAPGGRDSTGRSHSNPGKNPLFSQLDAVVSKLNAGSVEFPMSDSIVSVVDSDASVRDIYSISELPTAFFVGASGIVRDVLIGPAVEPDQIDAFLSTLMSLSRPR